jgi:acetyl-CoA carboxylase biotin carboxylase subunit
VWPSGEGVRVDTHIFSGARIPPFYDSLMAKIIVHASDRSTALERMRNALAATRIEGVATNVSFHTDVLADPEFERGGVDTGFLARFFEGRIVQEARVHG